MRYFSIIFQVVDPSNKFVHLLSITIPRMKPNRQQLILKILTHKLPKVTAVHRKKTLPELLDLVSPLLRQWEM